MMSDLLAPHLADLQHDPLSPRVKVIDARSHAIQSGPLSQS